MSQSQRTEPSLSHDAYFTNVTPTHTNGYLVKQYDQPRVIYCRFHTYIQTVDQNYQSHGANEDVVYDPATRQYYSIKISLDEDDMTPLEFERRRQNRITGWAVFRNMPLIVYRHLIGIITSFM
jgi:hypothetical protein